MLGIPIKSINKLSALKIEGLTKDILQKIHENIEGTDRYLPDWAETGIRNQLVINNYCIGLVSPTEPANPMQKDKDIRGTNIPRQPYVQIGGYLWFKIAELKPVISKDEWEAYTYRLLCASADTGGLSSADKASVSVATRKECREVALQRLMLSAMPNIVFYDAIVDISEMLMYTDAPSDGSVIRVSHLMSKVLSGSKLGSDSMVEPEKETGDEVVIGKELIIRGLIHIDVTQESIRGYLDGKVREVNPDFSEVLSPFMPFIEQIDKESFYKMAAAGFFLIFGAGESYSQWLQEHIKMSDLTLGKKIFTLTNGMIEDIENGSITVEQGGFALKAYSGVVTTVSDDPETKMEYFSRVKPDDLITEILNGGIHIIFKGDNKVASSSNIVKSNLEVTMGAFDMKAKIDKKGLSLKTLIGGLAEPGIVPLQVNLNFSDVVDRVGNTFSTLLSFRESAEEVLHKTALVYLLSLMLTGVMSAKGDIL